MRWSAPGPGSPGRDWSGPGTTWGEISNARWTGTRSDPVPGFEIPGKCRKDYIAISSPKATPDAARGGPACWPRGHASRLAVDKNESPGG
jgi:hypothetical protein